MFKFIQRIPRGFVWLSLALVFCLFLFEMAEGRPGGGSGYSSGGGSYSGGGGSSYSGGGGGSSSSGGGDGDGGAILMLVFYLLQITLQGLFYFAVEFPYIALPLYAFTAFYLYRNYRLNKKRAITSGGNAATRRKRNTAVLDRQLSVLKTQDPHFSTPVFLDFVTALYHEFYSRFSKKDFAQLRPYLEDSILHANNLNDPVDIHEIVLGAVAIYDISLTDEWQYIQLNIHSNFTEKRQDKTSRHQLQERWMLRRKAGLISPEPDKMRGLNCPSCGAGLSLDDQGSCGFCGTHVVPGDMQWELMSKTTLQHQVLSSNAQSLLAYAPEVGNDYPTVVAPDVANVGAQLAGSPAAWLHYQDFFREKVVIPTFMQVYEAWSSLKWEKALPVVSDRLWHSYLFWIQDYKTFQIMPRLENIRVSKVEVARVEVDHFYESITVRIHASCLDYKTDPKGKVLAGDAKRSRYFTEYWTFIKNRAVAPNWEGDAVNLHNCPNCGAPLQLNQAAECHSCGSKVNTGQFNWVLSTIEQDDDYGLEV
ncbi:MAG: TIM44-like domain-containing protein [Bacteroidetes bacterium]|nr:TIM44-like domain-containing protein [Bacteroidota bacterium]